MQQSKPFPPDEVCNPNWDSLLRVFHGINPASKTAKQEYTSLKELAQNSILTERQHEGIRDRCDNKIAEIGNPKKVNANQEADLEKIQKIRSGK